MTKPINAPTTSILKTLIIGVTTPQNQSLLRESYYDEFINLIKTHETPYQSALFIKMRAIDPGYFFTKGKLDEILRLCKQENVQQVIISESLSGQQERNLSELLNCIIIDRTQLILEIFEKAAQSAEGKTQVAIAMLQHRKTRLAGKGIHLSQQAGVTGVRGGPGETAKEKERRYIEDSIEKLKRQLKKIQQVRQTQRKRRLSANVAHICLIGYTNAGKSTILNALTKSSVLAQDKLFATLDTTTRELYIDGTKKGILSDTVGFIQNLPTKLIEAFKSTLDELQYADLLLQVVDIADPSWESHIRVVHSILEDLNVNKDMVYVFNKADRLPPEAAYPPAIERYQPHVVISALDKSSLEPLIRFLSEWTPGHVVDATTQHSTSSQ